MPDWFIFLVASRPSESLGGGRCGRSGQLAGPAGSWIVYREEHSSGLGDTPTAA